MSLIKDIIFCAAVAAFIFHTVITVSSVYNGEIGKCYDAHLKSGQSHIKFKSENHIWNWCDAHENDWREISTDRVLDAAAPLDNH
jgi:hypothetical protein